MRDRLGCANIPITASNTWLLLDCNGHVDCMHVPAASLTITRTFDAADTEVVDGLDVDRSPEGTSPGPASPRSIHFSPRSPPRARGISGSGSRQGRRLSADIMTGSLDAGNGTETGDGDPQWQGLGTPGSPGSGGGRQNPKLSAKMEPKSLEGRVGAVKEEIGEAADEVGCPLFGNAGPYDLLNPLPRV